MTQRVVLASSNRGKLAEFNALLADSGFEVVAQSSLGIADAEETGLSFVENALLKARHAARASGLPALADDSGLCVAHLRGAPGLYSARYAGGHGDSATNNAKLLRALDGVAAAQRGAFFICALALLADADDPAPLIAEGRWHGRVLDAPRGEQGFGYDPLFLPHGQALSAAELDPALKNTLSHRGQALAQLRARLAERHA
ncbi:RdgB/HAM1 family non-canonical purine NTP pyrophosphatase [Rhodanobacter sp. KK11]|uniref:RdgB/HAM1 family non-canonical purine NTP pyrophosphatase n=1 Tax=Rhodanobacter sp. KK11 TaxID=3083255 RepID=UPI0029666E8F|nr:RdgB/HAM1 family non-canonical purine NTP pyrophosphatase [Rhodanobacter sp. KK11]MDW2980288.1 RdgB/HAM1 family non-canonical purine NTP pyrophosphatase [Rhodanobacter sp. KK11]